MISKDRRKMGVSKAPAVLTVAVLMVVAALCAFAVVTEDNEVDGETDGGITYVIKDGILTISSNSSDSYPGKMKDYNGEDAPWYESRESITTINISSDVTYVGDYAFSGFGPTKLLVNGSPSFGKNAFAGTNYMGICGKTTESQTESSTMISTDPVVWSCFTDKMDGNSSLVGTICISGKGKMADYDSSSPPFFQHTIPEWSTVSNFRLLVTEGVTYIGKDAFKGWTVMSEAMFGSAGDYTIGEGAFEGCTSLKGVTLKSTTVHTDAFDPSTKISYWSYDAQKKTLTITGSGNMTNYTKSGYPAWRNLPDGAVVEEVRFDTNEIISVSYAFMFANSNLKRVYLSEGITTLNVLGFYNCSNIVRMNLPSTLITMNASTLTGLKSLERFTGDSPILSDDKKLVFSDTNKKSVVAAAGNNTSFNIPYNVTSLVNYLFSGYETMSTVTIPDTVTGLAVGVFGSTSISEIVVVDKDGKPSSKELELTQIPNSLFQGDVCLTEFEIPSKVTAILPSAFGGCTGLHTLTIPVEVTEIGKDAFSGCNGLISIKFEGNVPSKMEAIIPENVKYILVKSEYLQNYKGNSAFSAYSGKITAYDGSGWTGSDLISETKGGYTYSLTYEGVFTASYNGDGTGTISSSMFEGYEPYITEVVIGSGITAIDSYAFRNCTSLRSVHNSGTDSLSISTIGDGAFQNCKALSGLELGGTVSSLGVGAFGNCYGIKSLTISNGSLTLIPQSAFSNCRLVNDLIIPINIESIGSQAFSGLLSLETLTIPDSVSISENNFGNCPIFRTVTVMEGSINEGDNDKVVAFYYDLSDWALGNGTGSSGQAKYSLDLIILKSKLSAYYLDKITNDGQPTASNLDSKQIKVSVIYGINSAANSHLYYNASMTTIGQLDSYNTASGSGSSTGSDTGSVAESTESVPMNLVFTCSYNMKQSGYIFNHIGDDKSLSVHVVLIGADVSTDVMGNWKVTDTTESSGRVLVNDTKYSVEDNPSVQTVISDMMGSCLQYLSLVGGDDTAYHEIFTVSDNGWDTTHIVTLTWTKSVYTGTLVIG